MKSGTDNEVIRMLQEQLICKK